MLDKDENVQDMILEASVKLFERFGYRNVRISDITRELGMTTGFFYYHFRSKEQVLQLIYENYITMSAKTVHELAAKRGLNATEKLKALVHVHCIRIKEYHAQVSVFFREYRNLPEVSIKNIQDRNSDYLKDVMRIIDQGRREGLFKPDLNSKLVSFAIIGMCNWIYQWYQDGRGQTIEEVADVFYKLISGGLLKS